MKRIVLSCMASIIAIPLLAQYSGPGFYRIQNQGEAGRYISIQNDKVSEESKSISLSSGKAVNEAVEALQLVKSKDGNPGTILYISGSTSGFTIEAQGMNTEKLLNDFGYGNQSLQMSSQGELNTVYSGYQIDLIDYGFNFPVKRENSYCGVATLSYIRQLETNEKKYSLWKIKKIDNQKEFFGINPSENVKVGDKYYTTLFTCFAYQLKDGMKAYYIDQHIYDTNHVQEPIAELKEITNGIIPASTPVIIECSSSNVEDNKVSLLNETISPISGNELKGRIFCYVPTANEDQSMKNALEFNQSTMRVLGVVDEKLAFVADNSAALNKGYIPANKAYLPISSTFAAVTAHGIKLLLPEEYAVATSISKITNEETSAKEGIYTLTGVKVKEDNNTNNLPRGIYIINGKKQVIK